MVTRTRFSTATVVDGKYLVPWLAAKGLLAYRPAAPPARDYFFQYTWILPGIFSPEINLREHRYFGSPVKDYARFLFDFWASVREDRVAAIQHYGQPGVISEDEVRTPLAAYRHVRKLYNTPGSLLIQHGSYQWVSLGDQPNIEQGEVLLFRGIGKATVFRCLRFRPQDLSPANLAIWRKYVRVQADMLSDSVLSFNTIHDRVNRTETKGLLDESWLADTLAAKAGLDIRSPGFARDLWRVAQQSYSLDPVMGVRKFGPHYVVVKASLSNIRITTFFAGESEVKIADPSRISELQGFGCEVEFIRPTE